MCICDTTDTNQAAELKTYGVVEMEIVIEGELRDAAERREVERNANVWRVKESQPGKCREERHYVDGGMFADPSEALHDSTPKIFL